MELSLSLLLAICAAAAVAGLWHANLAAREAANRAAVAACEELRLQFLDGTVAFARARVVRTRSGWLGLRRTYVFDYTADSISRRRGFIVMTGARVDSVGFESDDRPASSATSAARRPSGAAPDRAVATVQTLDNWRNRRTPQRDGPDPRSDPDR